MKNYIVLFFIIVAYACGNATNNAPAAQNNASIPKTLSDSIYKSVMDGHEVSMLQMGEIIRLKNKITQQKD
jgi:hypothetical protein